MVKRERVLTHTDQDEMETTFRVASYGEPVIAGIFSVVIGVIAVHITALVIHHHAVRYLGLLGVFGGFILAGVAKAGDLGQKRAGISPRWIYSHRMARIALMTGMLWGFALQSVPASWKPLVMGFWVTCLFFLSMVAGDPADLPESMSDGSFDFLVGFGVIQWLAFGWQWVR